MGARGLRRTSKGAYIRCELTKQVFKHALRTGMTRDCQPAACHYGRSLRVTLYIALALAGTPLASAQNASNDTSFGVAFLRATYPKHDWEHPVRFVLEPVGPTRSWTPPAHLFRKVKTDEDQADLYDDNLMRDLAPWRRRATVSMAALAEWAAALPARASRRLVLLRQGRVVLLPHPGQGDTPSYGCTEPCDPIMQDLLADLRQWVAASPSDWPDVAFVLNVADTSMCQDTAGAAQRRSRSSIGPCPAPVLSVIKEWDKFRDEDILVPITVGMHRWQDLVYFPPDKKIDRAVFRGREYCHTKFYPWAKDTCARTYLALKAATSPDWQQLLDVGLLDNVTVAGSKSTGRQQGQQQEQQDGRAELVHVPARGFVHTLELARFRYTLALDGITASSRLARLLTINSPVLKQASPWIEWYYRSLVPGVHYISFWNHHRTDILYTIRHLRHNVRYLQEVALQGQAFAYRHLTPHARMLYWRRALHQYKQLFGDMDAFVSQQVLPAGEYDVHGLQPQQRRRVT